MMDVQNSTELMMFFAVNDFLIALYMPQAQLDAPKK